MAKERQPFDFGNLLNQVSAQSAPYVMQANRGLYGMFPKTARAASGYTGKGIMTPAMLRKGAMGVSTMGVTRFPLVQGTLQTLSGDPIGGFGTAGGGFIGAKLGAKVGLPFAAATGGLSVPVAALVGGLIGAGTGQSVTRGLAGIDINDPLTGPDFSLPIGKDGIPLTQYARTKKSMKRAMDLEKMRLNQLLPMIEKAKDKQFQRDLITGQMQMAGQLLGNIYPR
jgi:hypothetical protein